MPAWQNVFNKMLAEKARDSTIGTWVNRGTTFKLAIRFFGLTREEQKL
jgi:hypothetical protein